MNIYAHRSTSTGVFTDTDGTTLTYTSRIKKEDFQKYKDCGFNVLYPQENPYSGETWSSSWMKIYMDLAAEVGLKCIVADKRIVNLSASTTSLIGTGDGQYESIEALAEELRDYMEPYYEHSAFYGVVTKDEPDYNMLPALGQVIQALKLIDSDMYIKVCLLPYSGGVSNERYTGEAGTATFDSYQTYVNQYLTCSGQSNFGYDHYPYTSSGTFLGQYLRTLQNNVVKASAGNADVELVVQSFAMQDSKRLPDLTELYFQNNAALAFGVKNIGYFSYWRCSTSSSETHLGGILNYNGSSMIYDEVQEVLNYTRKMASVVLNFDYVKAQVLQPSADTDTSWCANVTSASSLDNMTVSNVTQRTIVTQMYDSVAERNGYMVVNAYDTINTGSQTSGVTNSVTLTFAGYDKITYYSASGVKTKDLTNGQITLSLAEGQAAFVIPHN